MFESVFVVLGLLIFTKLLFDKWDLWNPISAFGSKTDKEWIYKLLNCRFCLMFWVSILITIIYGIMNGFDLSLIFVPFAVNGIKYLIYQ